MTRTQRRLARTLIVTTSVLGFAGAALAAPGPVDVVKKANDDFNHGAMKAATAAFAAEGGAVIDEFAPYEWHGPNAINDWLGAFDAFAKARHRTDNWVKTLAVVRSDVDGDSAYVVLRELYTYKEHGRRMSEMGDAAWTLHKGADGWKVTGTAWAGSHPSAVVAAAKPAAAATAAPAKKP